MRRTQEERSAATRRLLLDATIDCLVKYGYAGTTTMRVAELAGVSRGAMVHHYATKADLVLGAVQHLASRQVDAVLSDVGRLRSASDGVGEALEVVWEVHQGPLFEASIELWVAARTDLELRTHLVAFERALTASMVEVARTLLGARAAGDSFEADLFTVLEAVRGLRLHTFIQPSPTSGPDPRWLRLKPRLHRLLTTP